MTWPVCEKPLALASMERSLSPSPYSSNGTSLSPFYLSLYLYLSLIFYPPRTLNVRGSIISNSPLSFEIWTVLFFFLLSTTTAGPLCVAGCPQIAVAKADRKPTAFTTPAPFALERAKDGDGLISCHVFQIRSRGGNIWVLKWHICNQQRTGRRTASLAEGMRLASARRWREPLVVRTLTVSHLLIWGNPSQVVYTVGFIPRPCSLIGDFVSCLHTDKAEEASHWVNLACTLYGRK